MFSGFTFVNESNLTKQSQVSTESGDVSKRKKSFERDMALSQSGSVSESNEGKKSKRPKPSFVE